MKLKEKLRVWLIRKLGGQVESDWATEIRRRGLKPVTVYEDVQADWSSINGDKIAMNRARGRLADTIREKENLIRFDIVDKGTVDYIRASVVLLVPEDVAPEEVRDG